MTITVLVSVTGQLLIVSINNYLLLLPTLYSLCLQKALLLVMVLELVDDPHHHSPTAWQEVPGNIEEQLPYLVNSKHLRYDS